MAQAKKAEAEEKQSSVPATTQKGGAVAAYDYGQEVGAGFEGTKGTDLSIPFLSILQSNSPQVEDKNPPNATPGQLFNTVTRELIDGAEGLVLLPCHKEQAYVEWVPREKGGGFVGLHDPASEEVKKAIEANGGNRIGKLKMDNGNDLVETHYVYGLILDADGKNTAGFAVVSFTSTKIKPFRDWLTAMFTLKGKPPMFANRARVKTVKQKNEKGTFYNFQIEPLGETWLKSLIDPSSEQHLLKEAREFREMVTSGVAKAAFETQNAAGGDGGDASADEVPF